MRRSFIPYLPQYFSRSYERRTALRVKRSDNATVQWRMADEQLVVTVDGTDTTFDLFEHTFGTLLDALQAIGFETLWVDNDLLALGALAIIPGSGSNANSNAIQLDAFTSLLYAMGYPIDVQLNAIAAALPEAVDQLSVATSDQYWLSLHGLLYGLDREAQDDEWYRQYILDEMQRPRNNARGIEKTLRRLMQRDLRVIEPWQWVATWDKSPMSTDHRFFCGYRWAKNLLQVTANDPCNWEQAQAIAEADRAAGCLLLPPMWTPLPRLVGGADLIPRQLMRSDVRTFILRHCWPPIWDVTRWDDYEVVRNYRIAILNVQVLLAQSCILPLPCPPEHYWTGNWDARHWSAETPCCRQYQPFHLDHRRTFCRSDAVFSEDSPLGDLNTRWHGGGYVEWIGADRRWSTDAAFSDYEIERRVVPICEWTERPLSVTQVVRNRLELRPRTSLSLTYCASAGAGLDKSQPTWTGCWDTRHWREVTCHLTDKPEVRICQQSAGAITPTWSDQAGLSDYQDGISCEIVGFDPDLGIAYPDPFTQQMVVIPPRQLPAHDIRVKRCGQIADGATPMWSGDQALSDYLDGFACEDLPVINSSNACLAGELPTRLPDELPADVRQRDNVTAVHVCELLPASTLPRFSEGAPLSNYPSAMQCAWVTFENVISTFAFNGQVIFHTCEQSATGESPSFSGDVALSNYQSGLTCALQHYDIATGQVVSYNLANPAGNAPLVGGSFTNGNVGTAIRSARHELTAWSLPNNGIGGTSYGWSGRWDGRRWQATRWAWRVAEVVRNCEQPAWIDQPTWSGELGLSNYWDALFCVGGQWSIESGIAGAVPIMTWQQTHLSVPPSGIGGPVQLWTGYWDARRWNATPVAWSITNELL